MRPDLWTTAATGAIAGSRGSRKSELLDSSARIPVHILHSRLPHLFSLATDPYNIAPPGPSGPLPLSVSSPDIPHERDRPALASNAKAGRKVRSHRLANGSSPHICHLSFPFIILMRKGGTLLELRAGGGNAKRSGPREGCG